MLSSSDWQLVCSVVVDDLRDSGEGRAVLSEHVAPICRLGELHVHEALTTPDRERRKKERFIFSYLIQPKLDFCVVVDWEDWKYIGCYFQTKHSQQGQHVQMCCREMRQLVSNPIWNLSWYFLKTITATHNILGVDVRK